MKDTRYVMYAKVIDEKLFNWKMRLQSYFVNWRFFSFYILFILLEKYDCDFFLFNMDISIK